MKAILKRFWVVYRAAELDYVGRTAVEAARIQTPVLATCEPFDTVEAAEQWIAEQPADGGTYVLLSAIRNGE